MKLFALSSLLMAVLFAGCSKSTVEKTPADGIVVQGEVTWKGKQLKWGSFVLVDPRDKKNGASADIVDGQFTIVAERRLKPGNYKVMIFGGMRPEDNPEASGPSVADGPTKDMLPLEHNERSKMMVEIKAEGANKLRYDLK